MCNNCVTGWGICACTGGDTFGKCPCSSGVDCPICGHSPQKKIVSIALGDLLSPELLKREQEVYEALQKAQGTQ